MALARAHERCWLPGWKGHNHYKLHLPTQCAAARALPWHRAPRSPRAVTPQRSRGAAEDALTCPLDTSRLTPRVPKATRTVSTAGLRLPSTGEPADGARAGTPAHNVSVVQVLASPRVRLLREFLTPEEAAEILSISQPLFHRSPVRSVATDRRTSSTATLAGVTPAGMERRPPALALSL